MNKVKTKNGMCINKKTLGVELKKHKYCYIMLIPAVLQTLVFAYIPMAGILMAFQKFDIVKGLFGSEFVGLYNFKKILTDTALLRSIKNTVLYGVVNLFFAFPLPIILALLLNEIRHTWFKRTVQSISYLPHFLSWVSVIAMFYSFFAMQGSFNDLMCYIKGDSYSRVNILMDPKYFLSIIYFSGVWKALGWSAILYMAAISSVDQTLYEAAYIDGCGRFKRMYYITIPCILPTIVICFILASGGLMKSNFEQVFGFQNIFTQEATDVIDTVVYRRGILGGEYSLSTAFGITQGIVSFGLVFITNKIANKLSGIGIW